MKTENHREGGRGFEPQRDKSRLSEVSDFLTTGEKGPGNKRTPCLGRFAFEETVFFTTGLNSSPCGEKQCSGTGAHRVLVDLKVGVTVN